MPLLAQVPTARQASAMATTLTTPSWATPQLLLESVAATGKPITLVLVRCCIIGAPKLQKKLVVPTPSDDWH
jgi:hypothetical protein